MNEQKFKYYIYKIVNVISGKIYIGQHKVRKNGEGLRTYMGKGIALKEAYKKYGIKNFEKTIIEELEDDEKHEFVSEREKYWIKQFNSIVPNGYNISPGGEGGITSELAQKSRNTRLQRFGNFSLSEETKRKISISNKGKQKSELHKQHLSEHHHLKTLHIIVFSDETKQTINTYDSIDKIAKKFGCSSSKTLRINSSVGIFTNGIRLLDCFGKKYAGSKLTIEDKEKLINGRFFDPIKNDVVSYYTLRSRKAHHIDLYKNIVIVNQMIH